METKKIEGFDGKAYKYEYIEEETETEIIMTARAVFNKNSKTAVNKINKSKETGILPLCTILKRCTNKPIKE